MYYPSVVHTIACRTYNGVAYLSLAPSLSQVSVCRRFWCPDRYVFDKHEYNFCLHTPSMLRNVTGDVRDEDS